MALIDDLRAIGHEVSIETPAGVGICHEMGHFVPKILQGGETREDLRGNVVRRATIPRANAMMTTTELKPGTIADAIGEQDTPFFSAKLQANDDALQKFD